LSEKSKIEQSKAGNTIIKGEGRNKGKKLKKMKQVREN
jgi:hypothetical protein